MMRIFKQAVKIVWENWYTLLWFEILYKLIGSLFVFPAIQDLLARARTAIGLSYISFENIQLLLTHPLSILLLVCTLIIFAYYIYFEISALILLCENGWAKKSISIFRLCKLAFFQSVRIFYYKNLPVFLVILPLMVLSIFRLSSSVLQTYRLPEFIQTFIAEDKAILFGFSAVLILTHLALFLHLFGIPSVILSGCDYIRSWHVSYALLKKNMFKTAIRLVLYFLISAALILLIASTAIFLLYAYSVLFFDGDQSRYIFQINYRTWNGFGLAVLQIISAIWFWAGVIVLYHRRREAIALPCYEPKKKIGIRLLKGSIAILSAVIILMIFSETELGGRLNIPTNPQTIIVAHRAGAYLAPENTVAALQKSIQCKADFAEIDVQQARDGTLIVMHDSNFRRTTGIDRNVWDADYDEIKSFDAGNGERIPTLEEILIAGKNHIDFMIELKSADHQHNLVEETLDLIQKLQMEKQCTIASMNLDILKEVKQLAPSIATAYISVVLLSEKYDMHEVDGYSVETTALSLGMVSQAHLQGKKVYAWTANSEQTIKKILSCRADGLVTDDPELAGTFLNASNDTPFLRDLINLLYAK